MMINGQVRKNTPTLKEQTVVELFDLRRGIWSKSIVLPGELGECVQYIWDDVLFILYQQGEAVS